MLGLEERVALRQLEQRRRSEGTRDGEQRHHRLLVEASCGRGRRSTTGTRLATTSRRSGKSSGGRSGCLLRRVLRLRVGLDRRVDDLAGRLVDLEGAVLAVQQVEAADNVEREKAGRVVEQAAKAHREVALQVLGVLLVGEQVLESEMRFVGGQARAPRQLTLEVVAVLRVDELEHALVDDVRLCKPSELKNALDTKKTESERKRYGGLLPDGSR